MKLSSNDKLVLIGDSITDSDRKRPVGEGIGESLGRGYVSLVNALLTAVYPELAIRVVNVGSSGHNVRDLKDRWQSDIIDLKPDWLSIMIGTNDVWRQYDQPLIAESHVYIDEYEVTLRALINETLPMLKGLILMTPFYIEPNRNDAMRNTMDQYSQVVRRLAEEYGAIFVDTQAAFDQLMIEIYPATIAWDRVHPSMVGHMTIARAFLKELGFQFEHGIG
ncbi:MAG: SGNH/GDSL hydrolase family protein [Paenibacillaceae bacterium]